MALLQTTQRLRLALVAAAITLLLMQGVATTLLVARAREAALLTALDTVNRISRSVEASINRNFVQVDAMLAGLPAVLRPFIQDGVLDAAGAGRVLRELNNQNFTFRDVLLFGSDSTPLTSGLAVSRRRPLPIPLGPDFFALGPSVGGLTIGGPVRNPITGEWSVFFARPVTIQGLGTVAAVAEVPVPLIATLLAAGGESPGLRVTLERNDGLLLATQPHDETRIARHLPKAASSLPTAGQTTSRFDDRSVLVAVRPTLYPSLFVTASVEAEAALATWRQESQRALAVSGLFSLLVLALAAALLVGLRQREKVEAERASWRARLENALESMSDGFVMFGPDDRLIACNQRYKDFYAISAPFIHQGAHFRDIMREGAVRGQYPQAGPDIDAFINAMDAWRHANNPPIERLLPDGRWVLITERSTADGGTVGIRTDITQLKRTMEELAAARDAARAAGEAKSRFLARMSHELRTPLNGILGFAQVLLADPELSAAQREQVATLNEAGRHLLELVNGLLDLSKIEAGKLELQPRPVALRPLLDACAGLLAPEVARKGLRFDVDVAPNTPEGVEADPTRLRQMLLNLLGNAVKFTPEGGRVQLRARRLPDGFGIRLEVQDSGPGIPQEKRHLLFEDFAQLAAAPGQEQPGTGLGLAISARLAGAMGGRIGCDAEMQQGALFWVELPLREVAPPAPAAIEAPKPRAGESRRLRVLVADDVAANRMVARAMLVAAGHSVDSASDGAEAVAALEREPYDVVLMDVQMPVMDGLDATRRIRELPGTRGRVPILAVTASALPEQIAACHEAGMDGHLAKPIDRESLLQTVGRLAAGLTLEEPSVPVATLADAPLVDSAALASLATDLGPTAGVVIAEFVAELRLGVETLGAEVMERDTQRLRQAAHRLLGAARTLGARRLAKAIEALQQRVRSNSPFSEALQRVRSIGAATLPALEIALQPAAVNDPGPAPATHLAMQGSAD
ncbi:response regulator [Roseomonas sp. AR75]|uniref:response regulator n=1 Tax=Roseomonas sp. AR75 TaxID=2562311 RepID=UPI0010C1080B|nr:response regulator [Roseomonas sp. AR75]